MAQVKIYGLKNLLRENKENLSKAIHESLMDAFGLPENKRFHRFFLLNEDEFIYPSDRSDKYTIIELSIFEGRSIDAKKMLINLIFSNIKKHTGIDGQDVEITILETPVENWGIRGVPADELTLNYKVKV